MTQWWDRSKMVSPWRTLVILKGGPAVNIADAPFLQSRETTIYGGPAERRPVPELLAGGTTPERALYALSSTGFATDRSSDTGNLKYTFQFDVHETGDSYWNRRHKPSVQEVRDWLYA